MPPFINGKKGYVLIVDMTNSETAKLLKSHYSKTSLNNVELCDHFFNDHVKYCTGWTSKSLRVLSFIALTTEIAPVAVVVYGICSSSAARLIE